MAARFFADQTVKLSQLPSFRAEHFPYAGPYPWLDRPDAIERIDQRLKLGELTEEDAEQCRFWSRHGYVILKKLIDDATLDTSGAPMRRRFVVAAFDWKRIRRPTMIHIRGAF